VEGVGMAMEFPEMSKIAGQLNKELVGKIIRDVELSEKCNKLIEWTFVNLKERDIRGRKVTSVTNRGHYVYGNF